MKLEVNLILWPAPGQKPVLLGRLRDPDIIGLARTRLAEGRISEAERLISLSDQNRRPSDARQCACARSRKDIKVSD